MARESLKEIRNISYLSKDFDSIKQDLIEYLKQNFPESWQDFNEASGGMAILELIAYIGDQMSFYIDRQANETFINRAVEEKNIIALSKSLGRKPKFVTPATVNLSVSAVMTQSTSSQSLFTLNKGTRVITPYNPSISFELIDNVDFSLTANRTLTSDGVYTTASVSSVSAVAGQSRTFTYTAGSPTEFLKITLPDTDITEITSVSSSDGNEWYEVDYLAQDSLFVGETNDTSSSSTTPCVLKVKRVPRRYVVEKEPSGITSLRFGSGKLSVEDSEIVPNPEDFVLPPTLRGSASSFSPNIINSSTFLNTKSFGIAPGNVSLDITYRYGGGVGTNVGSNLLIQVRDRKITWKNSVFSTVSATEANLIERNISITNPLQATGGSERESLTEMRENALAFFSAQQRAVTLQDYQILSMSMPSKFGSVFRSYARKDPSNSLGVELFLISKDSDGYLCAPSGVLKNNVETFMSRYKSFSDSIKMSDGKIINLRLDFSIVPEPNINANEALLDAFYLLKRLMDVSNASFSDTIVISDIMAQIQGLDRVRSVASFNITNVVGTVDGRTYSNVEFDVTSHTTNNIITFPNDSIWEFKFVNSWDIVGRSL